jgi:hypothetical protein
MGWAADANTTDPNNDSKHAAGQGRCSTWTKKG